MKTATDRAALLVLLVLLPAVARASPTGLNQIPTTDLVPFGQLTLQLGNGNSDVSGGASVFHQPELIPQSEIGLPWNMETGLDVAPSSGPDEYRPIFNIKCTPVQEGYWIPAVGSGISQVGPGFTPNYYLTLTKTLNYQAIQYQKFRAHHRNIKLRGIRVHAGIMRTAAAWRALVGTDIEVNDYFVIYSDWISGSQNSVSLGGVLVINQHDSVQAALLRGNDQDRLSGALLVVTHTFDFDDPWAW